MKDQIPKIGMMTNPSEYIISEINSAHRLGAEYVEIDMEPFESMPENIFKKRKNILAALRSFPSKPIMHTAYWIDLGSPYEKIRKAWLDEIKKEIVVASQLKIDKFNIHLYAEGLMDKKKHQRIILDNYIKSLRELVIFAKKHKIKIILENVPHPWANFENFRYIVDSVPGLFVHLDLGHVFITDNMKGFKKFIPYFAKKIEHVHIHDNFGKHDDHLPLGKGKIDFAAVVKELKKIDYDKTITFEVFTNEKDFISSIKFFKRL